MAKKMKKHRKQKPVERKQFKVTELMVSRINSKVASKHGRKICMSRDAAQSLVTMANTLVRNNICNTASNIAMLYTRNQSFGSAVAAATVKMVVPGQLGKDACKAGMNAIAKFRSAED